jgi:epoxyqueuosine reductase
MKQAIINYAKKMGFVQIGFATAHSLYNQYSYLNNWLKKGFNAEMSFFERNTDKRKAPSLLLNNLKTIIVLAKPYPYFHNISHIKIANYALSDDYHHTIKLLLENISQFLHNNYNANCRTTVDTSPIMEKQWAILAGIGWQGKNSLIVNEAIGSFFNIGIILTDIEIEPDTPSINKCGNCNKCITHCPTSAIVAPAVIDCNKCISYHTIENKTIISDEIVEKIIETGCIFGCDICQNVCPYNKIIIESSIHTNQNKFENLTTEEILILLKKYSAIRPKQYNRLIEYINLCLNKK